MTFCAKPVRVNSRNSPPLNTECPDPKRCTSKEAQEEQTSNSEAKIFIRRPCGCLKTSEKLKHILKMFPQAPPPTGYCKEKVLVNHLQADQGQGTFCAYRTFPTLPTVFIHDLTELQEQNFKIPENLKHVKSKEEEVQTGKKHDNRCKAMFQELVSLLQLSVTATALIIYYIIFCYMQLVYYVLRSVVYFHHADLPMKITILAVTMTGMCLGLNVLARMENLVSIHFRQALNN